jgi:hypothetical protein
VFIDRLFTYNRAYYVFGSPNTFFPQDLEFPHPVFTVIRLLRERNPLRKESHLTTVCQAAFHSSLRTTDITPKQNLRVADMQREYNREVLCGVVNSDKLTTYFMVFLSSSKIWGGGGGGRSYRIVFYGNLYGNQCCFICTY